MNDFIKPHQNGLIGSFKKLFPLMLLVMLFVASCQKEGTNDFDNAIAAKKERINTAAKNVIDLVQQHQIRSVLEEPAALSMRNTTPLHANGRSNSELPNAKVIETLAKNEDFQRYRKLLQQAINPDDFECGPTELNAYVGSLVQNFTSAELDLLFNFGTNIPFLEVYFFDNTQGGDQFGTEGQFTSTLQKTFLKLKYFWDIPTDIQLADLKGTVFTNVPLVAQIIQMFYINFDEEGNPLILPIEIALAIAENLKIVFGMEVFDQYNHPLFSFNAFAVPAIPELGLPKKIVMGDGIMEAYSDLGYSTIADRFILAHEYGHQIQFANGYIPQGERTPEETRRIELMADAYAAYFMAHGRGAFIQPLLIEQFVKISFSIGDCAFDSPGHHGTPNQRAKAAAFGSQLAAQENFLSKRLSSEAFFELFEAALPELIEPDAE